MSGIPHTPFDSASPTVDRTSDATDEPTGITGSELFSHSLVFKLIAAFILSMTLLRRCS